MRTLLADLGEPYKRSSQEQVKVLFGSIFPSGFSWHYNGTLNHQISPIYQSIRMFEIDVVPLGARERTWTSTACATAPSRLRVYQFPHPAKEAVSELGELYGFLCRVLGTRPIASIIAFSAVPPCRFCGGYWGEHRPYWLSYDPWKSFWWSRVGLGTARCILL